MFSTKKGSPFRKILYYLGVPLVSMGFSALLCWAWGEHLVKYSSDANQLTYLGRYYNWVNRHTTGNNQVDNICVVDFHEASPDDSLVRYRIACAIERICDFDPLVVALDIRFKGRRNAWEDDYLEDVILRNRNRLVITRYMFNEEYRSYFDTDSANLQYGYANIGDFYTRVSNYEPSFSETVLKKAGLFDSAFVSKHSIVDFSNLGVEKLNPETLMGLSDKRLAEFLNGRIVLLADLNDEKDHFRLPFLIEGRDWMNGAYYHIYCMNSMQEGGPRFRENIWISLSICLFLTLSYFLLAGWFSSCIKKEKKVRGETKRYFILLFAKPITMTVIWLLIPVFMMGVITHVFRIAPNLVIAMVSVSMIIGFFENFLDAIKEKWVL